jgi:ATP-dependent Clp protease ATP-binding subunit ClpC
VVQVAGCMNVYERFTDRARGVVILADLACRELGQGEVGTEHLLLGVTQEVGTAHHVLRAMGVTPERVRGAVTTLYGTDYGAGDATPEGKLEYADEAHSALETALREAIGLRHERVGTEHLLLGLLRNNASRGVMVLRNLRVDPDSVRERVFDLIAAPGFVSPELATHDTGPHAIASTGSGPAPVSRTVDGIDVRVLADEVARLRSEVYELRAALSRLESR